MSNESEAREVRGRHDCFDVQNCPKAEPCACGEVRGHLWNDGGVRVGNVQHRRSINGPCYIAKRRDPDTMFPIRRALAQRILAALEEEMERSFHPERLRAVRDQLREVMPK